MSKNTEWPCQMRNRIIKQNMAWFLLLATFAISSCAKPQRPVWNSLVDAQNLDSSNKRTMHNYNFVTSKDIHGDTILLWASKEGQYEIAKVALEKGANINEINKTTGETALINSSRSGHVELTKMLIQKGADIELKDNTGTDALSWACTRGHLDVFRVIIENNRHVSFKNMGACLALSSYSDNKNLINSLVQDYDVDINSRDQKGNTSLMIATKRNQLGLIKLLIDLEVDINIKDNYGRNSLILAVQGENIHIAKYLINSGSHIDIPDNEGLTPLHYASLNNNFAIVNLLIKEGADVNIRDNSGRSALHLSILKENEDVAKIILQAGAEVYPVESTTEDIYATAISYQRMAKNCAKFNKFSKVKVNYVNSLTYYEKASLGFSQKIDEISDEIKRKEFSVSTQNYLKIIAAVGAQAALDYGAQVQAQQQARFRAQMSALEMANMTGTGYTGYFRAMDSFNGMNYAVTNSQQVPVPQMEKADVANAKKLKESYIKLYEKSLQEMDNIKNLLEDDKKNLLEED